MIGIKTLTIGYTKDIELAEKIARATGAQELFIETRPEGNTLMLNDDEQAMWRDAGWTLQGRSAKKTLAANAPQENPPPLNTTKEETKGKTRDQEEGEGGADAGRLKASMLYESE